MRYLALLIAALTSAEVGAVDFAPRLVVTVTIDQLRSDYMEAFNNFYSNYGFRRFLSGGLVYESASYPFEPVDASNAAATLSTGTVPFYNGIIGNTWLDRKTLQITGCVDDDKDEHSPSRMRTSTIGDELKISSKGNALVYSFAPSKENAILLGGHVADGAFWTDDKGFWTSSKYYFKTLPKWVKEYNKEYERLQGKRKGYQTNDNIVDMAISALQNTALGEDETTDLLNITLTTVPDKKNSGDWQKDMPAVYQEVDYSLGRIYDAVSKKAGINEVLFVITSTGYNDTQQEDLSKYRIPTGTFYINRTASLLNMYLGAIYGVGRYVEQEFNNEIYLNHRLIEQKRINVSELLSRCQEFLLQNAGVADVYTSERLQSGNNDIIKIRAGYSPVLSGDIIINVAPGWKLLNENNGQTYTVSASRISFPIIFFGAGIKHEKVSTPVSVDRIAPTIAKTIRIRAPNACSAAPLF